MIEVKAGEVVEVFPAMIRIGQERLPARAAYRVSRLLSKLRSEVNAFEAVRVELVKRLGVAKEGAPKGTFEIPADRMDEFNAQMEAMAAETCSIDYDPLPLSMFEGAMLASMDVSVAERFFVDDLPEAKAA